MSRPRVPDSSFSASSSLSTRASARCGLDREELGTSFSVDLGERDRPRRFDEEALLRTELAARHREPDPDRVVRPAVEDHQVVATIPVEVHGFEDLRIGCGVRQGARARRAFPFPLVDDLDLIRLEQGEVGTTVPVEVADGQRVRVLDGLPRVEPFDIRVAPGRHSA